MPDLNDLLAEASSHIQVSPPDVYATLATARTRRRRRTAAISLALVAVLGGAVVAVPQLNDNRKESPVATTPFPPLGPDERVARPAGPPYVQPPIVTSGRALSGSFQLSRCESIARWEVLDDATKVRTRVVVTGVGALDCPPGIRLMPASTELPTALDGRRLVVVSSEGEQVVRDTQRTEFPPLNKQERVARVEDPRVDVHGRTVTVSHVLACAEGGTRWDILESSDEVRLRLVQEVAQSEADEICSSSAVAKDVTSPFFREPLRGRRLVLQSDDGDLIAKEASVDPFPPLGERDSLVLVPSFAVDGRVLTANYTAGACETPATFDVQESPTKVRVRLTVTDTTPPGTGCGDIGLPGTATTRLSAPLGTRTLIRIGDDGATPVTPTRTP